MSKINYLKTIISKKKYFKNFNKTVISNLSNKNISIFKIIKYIKTKKITNSLIFILSKITNDLRLKDITKETLDLINSNTLIIFNYSSSIRKLFLNKNIKYIDIFNIYNEDILYNNKANKIILI